MVKLYFNFLHEARPYSGIEKFDNIPFSQPLEILPNTGDIVQIEGIKRSEGSFVVSHRVFSYSDAQLQSVHLCLGIEGKV